MENPERRKDRLYFSDDAMFERVMRDETIAKGVLEAILDVKVGRIVIHETQRQESVSALLRSIRMHFYIEDSDAVYDIEMQASAEYALGMRFRYYQSVIDAAALEKEEPFTALKKSFVIFIFTKDPIGSDIPVYTFEQMCLEDHGAKLRTKQRWIVLNAQAWPSARTAGLRDLLEYIESGKFGAKRNELLARIEREVDRFNEDDEWRDGMLTLKQKHLADIAAAQEEGEAKGEARGEACALDKVSRLARAMSEDARLDEFARAAGNTEELEKLMAEYGIA